MTKRTPTATTDAIASAAGVRCGATSAYLRVKAWLDAYLALVALVATAPLFGVLALLVRWSAPGPVLFRQRRAGLGGRPFELFKFRTMRIEADPYGDSPRTGDDPRITRVGRWLRETSLDELPQLLNVLRGEMSLIGPRPLYVQQISEWAARHRARLLVKPGLTGWAQIHGRAAALLESKLEWDVEYVERLNPALDAWIVWRTFANVVARRDIYEVRYSQERARRGDDQRAEAPEPRGRAAAADAPPHVQRGA